MVKQWLTSRTLRIVSVLLFSALLAPQNARCQVVDSIKGPVCVLYDSVSKKSFILSPERSTYNAVITDGLAYVKLTQIFVNSFGRIKDIAYVFPLPDKGSIHAMSLLYKNLLYPAIIMEKQEAQRKYDSVVSKGGSGALLLQERPNIFQQHLANIAYRDTARITIEFSMPLKYNSGAYELAIPTMIGERYQSAGVDFVPSGPFWNPPENRDGQTLQINVLIQTQFPITRLESPTHPITTDLLPSFRQTMISKGVIDSASKVDAPNACSAVLLSQTTYPNRDFVLRFSRKESKQDFSIASYFDTTIKQGYFALNLFPDTSLFSGARPNLDIVLLVDHSGSQDGWPLDAEKKVCNELLSRLLPTDKLSVLAFEDAITWAFGSALPLDASAANVATAKAFINGLYAMGGTQLLSGITSALATPQIAGYQRYYVFLTDGFVTNDSAIISTIKNHPSKPTVFTFGCGDNINRYLIDQAAATGGGGYGTVITQLEAAESVVPFVDAAWQKISKPQLKNITVDFGALGANNILMPGGSNLFVGMPIPVYGTFATGGQTTVTIKGTRNDTQIIMQKSIDFTKTTNTNFMVPKIWAREYIDYLSLNEGATQSNKSAIIEISVAYQVLSKYTAFLAINPQSPDKRNTAAIEGRHSALGRINKLAISIVNGILKLILPQSATLQKLSVFDARGRLVYSMAIPAAGAVQSLLWDGKLADGSKLKAGNYILCLQTSVGILKHSIVWR